MSRSLGDKLAHTVGVIPDPGIAIAFSIISICRFFLLKLGL
jgi:hypothetical protein